VLQCVAECCSVLQCVATQVYSMCRRALQCVAECCSVLQSVGVCFDGSLPLNGLHSQIATLACCMC